MKDPKIKKKLKLDPTYRDEVPDRTLDADFDEVLKEDVLAEQEAIKEQEENDKRVAKILGAVEKENDFFLAQEHKKKFKH